MLAASTRKGYPHEAAPSSLAWLFWYQEAQNTNFKQGQGEVSGKGFKKSTG
ncbi:MAG TPA: hypothetical protein VIJ25_11695 [Methylococcales bacterium]|jgi:hypothetical protein